MMITFPITEYPCFSLGFVYTMCLFADAAHSFCNMLDGSRFIYDGSFINEFEIYAGIYNESILLQFFCVVVSNTYSIAKYEQ